MGDSALALEEGEAEDSRSRGDRSAMNMARCCGEESSSTADWSLEPGEVGLQLITETWLNAGIFKVIIWLDVYMAS